MNVWSRREIAEAVHSIYVGSKACVRVEAGVSKLVMMGLLLRCVMRHHSCLISVWTEDIGEK